MEPKTIKPAVFSLAPENVEPQPNRCPATNFELFDFVRRFSGKETFRVETFSLEKKKNNLSPSYLVSTQDWLPHKPLPSEDNGVYTLCALLLVLVSPIQGLAVVG